MKTVAKQWQNHLYIIYLWFLKHYLWDFCHKFFLISKIVNWINNSNMSMTEICSDEYLRLSYVLIYMWLQLICNWASPVQAILFFFPFPFLWQHLHHMEASRSELKLQAYATVSATLDQSYICNLHHSWQQCRILNSVSEARDRTSILTYTMLGS